MSDFAEIERVTDFIPVTRMEDLATLLDVANPVNALRTETSSTSDGLPYFDFLQGEITRTPDGTIEFCFEDGPFAGSFPIESVANGLAEPARYYIEGETTAYPLL